jgi:hypothetical protein
MHHRLAYMFFVAALAGCGDGNGIPQKLALKTTAQILAQAQPSLQMESDYELASRAIPGALKTIEGFWISAPNNTDLLPVLTEGYCQYATAFVEDEWEVAKFAKKLDDVAYHNARATKMFTRCLNYALRQLGSRWERDIYGTTDVSGKLISQTDSEQRTALMWAGLALGGIINHNLNNIDVISYLSTVKLIVSRVISIDSRVPVCRAACDPKADAKTQPGCVVVQKSDPQCVDPNTGLFVSAWEGKTDPDSKALLRTPTGAEHTLAVSNCGDSAACLVHLALPHIAFGMVLSGQGAAVGGRPDYAASHFQAALRITGGKMLLAKVLWAYRVGIQQNDRKMFHDGLVDVLNTDPAIWSEQRLANEVAHRRARRYLSHEKELFQ